MGFTTSMPAFCGLRFVLGIAEAGFYPGVIYLTLWFPQSYRAKVLGIFTLGSALANMLGSLVGGVLLSLNGVCRGLAVGVRGDGYSGGDRRGRRVPRAARVGATHVSSTTARSRSSRPRSNARSPRRPSMGSRGRRCSIRA